MGSSCRSMSLTERSVEKKDLNCRCWLGTGGAAVLQLFSSCSSVLQNSSSSAGTSSSLSGTDSASSSSAVPGSVSMDSGTSAGDSATVLGTGHFFTGTYSSLQWISASCDSDSELTLL